MYINFLCLNEQQKAERPLKDEDNCNSEMNFVLYTVHCICPSMITVHRAADLSQEVLGEVETSTITGEEMREENNNFNVVITIHYHSH